MITKHYGRDFHQQVLDNLCSVNKEGSSLLSISDAAEKIGFESFGIKITIADLIQNNLPAILLWNQNHFVVLYQIKNGKYWIADPGKGLIKMRENDFADHWVLKGQNEGVCLLLSPKPKFYDYKSVKKEQRKWLFVRRYLLAYSSLFAQLLLALAVGSLLQLVLPFLTQSIVDIGINTGDLGFIYIILFAQIAITIGRVSMDFIRAWILLHISTRINVTILTDFLIKLMKLPMSFFDSKYIADIMQRMEDQRKIETFLTGPALNTMFSMFNLVIYSVVLAFYNLTILSVFLVSSIFYFAWIYNFLNTRKELNYQNFEVSAQNTNIIIQLVSGMQEIKLNNCEDQKRWEWENIQTKLFKFNVKSLKLTQYQQAGATLINESKNLLITFLSAKAVIDGNLTLGAMLAVQFIIGQLNNPIDQLLSFIQGAQDAQISVERLNDIHQMNDEEPSDKLSVNTLPADKTIHVKDLTFRYPGGSNDIVLDEINLTIPFGRTTAIVGMSGSGKTTLLKLLLRFYEPEGGEIIVGKENMNDLSFKAWRNDCGVVMQDSFIFSDSISRNIALGDEYPDEAKIAHAIKVAHIEEFIQTLPLGLNTRLGTEGNGLSQGQRQRLLIARAVYKDPHYIFFDEATNALDSSNERAIMDNLNYFFRGRTVVIVAHRLSTVSNADNIVVLSKGKIIEQGTHHELIALKGDYYTLVKNQLELGVTAN
jgi:ATP-binding cassette subfamily B protein